MLSQNCSSGKLQTNQPRGSSPLAIEFKLTNHLQSGYFQFGRGEVVGKGCGYALGFDAISVTRLFLKFLYPRPLNNFSNGIALPAGLKKKIIGMVFITVCVEKVLGRNRLVFMCLLHFWVR